MTSNGATPAGGRRAHLVIYGVLAGAWYLSMAAMFVAFPVVIVALLTTREHPLYVVWSAAMLAMLWLSLRVGDRAEPPGRVLSREEAPRLHGLVLNLSAHEADQFLHSTKNSSNPSNRCNNAIPTTRPLKVKKITHIS